MSFVVSFCGGMISLVGEIVVTAGGSLLFVVGGEEFEVVLSADLGGETELFEKGGFVSVWDIFLGFRAEFRRPFIFGVGGLRFLWIAGRWRYCSW